MSSLVHFGFIWSIQSTLVLCCPLQSYLGHSVHLGTSQSILFTLVLFGQCWSYSVHSVHFGPIQLTLILFSPLQSNWFLFGPIVFYLVHYVHFGPNLSVRSYTVHFGPFGTIRSILVHFGSPCSHSDLFCLFGQLRSIWYNSVQLCPFWSIFVHLHI